MPIERKADALGVFDRRDYALALLGGQRVRDAAALVSGTPSNGIHRYFTVTAESGEPTVG